MQTLDADVDFDAQAGSVAEINVLMTRAAPVDRLVGLDQDPAYFLREREIDAIHSMFPQRDRQTIATVLEEQQGIPNAVF
jgi:hypothetical protein